MASDQTQLYGDITGKRIKRCRTNLGWTQKELASRVGITAATINKYETGVTPNITRKRLHDIAQALSVSPIYLLGLTDDPNIITIADAKPGKIQYGVDINSDLEPLTTAGENFMHTVIVEQPAQNKDTVSTAFDPTEMLGPYVSSVKPEHDPTARVLSPQEQELLRIYNMISVRRQAQLLSYAYSLEDEEK